ncbi:hypothetical protein ES703_24195 [subsurface metagenome]
MKEKKKGSDAVKQTDPRHSTEIKHLLKSRQKELESQEVKLFMKFVKSYPPARLKIDKALAIWNFLRFLKKIGYYIIDGKTVFCFPFSHMVKLKDLK